MKLDIKKISLSELNILIPKGYIIDCRPLIDYRRNHLIESQHFDTNKEAVELYKNYPDEIQIDLNLHKVILLVSNGLKQISKEFVLYLAKFSLPIRICPNFDKYYEKYIGIPNPKLSENRGQMSEIITRFLYLGNQEDSENYELLKKKGITHIINATSHIKNSFPSKFTYLRIPILDSNGQNITSYFDATYKFIEDARKKGGRVLVHCYAGISRSATIVTAYIMRKHYSTSSSVLKILKMKRPIVNPNKDFREHLLKYEKYLIKNN